MVKWLFLIVLLASPVISMVSSFTKPNGDLDPVALSSHILNLEQTVSDLQFQARIQAQTNAAALTTVLSDLTATKEKLSKVETALFNMETKYNATLVELVELKTWKVNTETVLKTEVAKNSDEMLQVKNNVNSLKTQTDSTEKRLTDLMTNFTEELLSSSVNTETELNATRAEVSHVNASIQSSIIPTQMNLTTTLEVVGRKVDMLANYLDQRVFFKALIPTPSRFTANSTILFHQLESNIGEAYNFTSGVFLAPVSGIYFFAITVQTLEEGTSGFALVKNEWPEMEIFVRFSSDTGSSTTVFHINKGDKVFVTKLRDNLISPIRVQYCTVHFSGLLLQAD